MEDVRNVIEVFSVFILLVSGCRRFRFDFVVIFLLLLWEEVINWKILSVLMYLCVIRGYFFIRGFVLDEI